MSKCRHCGNDAGWFRGSHEPCESQYAAVKAAALQDASQGIVPVRFSDPTGIARSLAPAEVLVWAFQPTRYLERQRQRRGGHSYGLSVPVGGGARYGERFYERPQYEYVDQELDIGLLVVTDRGIHFKGGGGSIFRMSFATIDNVEVFTDGVGIHQRSNSTKPQRHRFVCHDGEFAGQLVWYLWQRTRTT